MAALGLMAGGVAHEINSPLSAILINAEFIKSKSGIVDPVIFKRAQMIVEIGNRIARLINALRIFSKDTGTEVFEDFKIKAVIEGTLDICEEKFKRSGIRIIVKHENLETVIRGQLVPLSQVLLNLLNNSYDAVNSLTDKWVQIDVVISSHFLELNVTDSGPGIRDDIKDKMFQPFFTTKDIGKGTGLGLSISKGIVESHGGELFYDENSSHTKFVIRLPIAATVADSGPNCYDIQ
jgi:C4-dicarboxylate-specific signal transduction histidine kinase